MEMRNQRHTWVVGGQSTLVEQFRSSLELWGHWRPAAPASWRPAAEASTLHLQEKH